MLRETSIDYRQLLEIFTGLAQATRFLRQDEAFCEGVTFHQYLILDVILQNKELKMADLHRHLAVEKSTTTRLLNPLIKKKLLQRRTDPRDLRAAYLTLTKKGEEAHKNVRLCIMDFFHKTMGNIPEKKTKHVLNSVNVFIGAIKAYARQNTCCR
ncbi:MAG TPA: MarR family transcriptional regulator [Smithellaceae bacterium]|nr:MarR family transcriptional regulator [Smithellaceae bacterium]HRS88864.1 MarR family transcriptional regulator [Smithellaceae bacterium]